MRGDSPDFNMANVPVKQNGAISVYVDSLLLIHCYQNEAEKHTFFFLVERINKRKWKKQAKNIYFSPLPETHIPTPRLEVPHS